MSTDVNTGNDVVADADAKVRLNKATTVIWATMMNNGEAETGTLFDWEYVFEFEKEIAIGVYSPLSDKPHKTHAGG